MNFSVVLQYITPHRRTVVLGSVLLVVSAGLSLLYPLIGGELTAEILSPEDRRGSAATGIIAAWAGLMVLRSLIGFATDYLLESAGETMTASLRNRVYEHMQMLPLSYFAQRRSGDTLALLSNDVEVISSFVTDSLARVLPMTLTCLGAFGMMFWIDPLIGFLVFLSLPLYIVALKLAGRRIRPLSRAWADAYSDMLSLVRENLELLPAMKSFRREALEQGRFDRENARLLLLSKRQILAESLLSPMVGLLTGIGLLGLLWLGNQQIASGGLDPAGLVSLLMYAVLLLNPLRTMANVYGQYQRTRGCAERVVDFFQVQPEPEVSDAPDLPRVSGHIEFRQVKFAYPDSAPVFRDLSFAVQAGETVAITGPNGAGKSTLSYLLLRHADPGAGTIAIDGVDIGGVSLDSLRSQVGLVAQHTLLLNGTVAENIAYGRPSADTAAIERAARAAQAHEFIERLPEGYSTVVGDQGMRLSGGQRQRLSLARTLLNDPPILILDEATAMFDPTGELGFVELSESLFQDKTVLLITHRPASLALADRQLRLQEGRVVEVTN